ncbi:Sodium-dependent nutrient amino acid transporter 1 [Orchesella cincta]|uniref:Sodium-dependent nutrient amino acid transporter 1 n=1 Tax=Orchesella cincta TaxID=48709 RepID=A0A1D2MKI8_ORCCI|nr:Sodium-dependent nutrient amino acid transporter 1 [Orchesella cincta]
MSNSLHHDNKGYEKDESENDRKSSALPDYTVAVIDSAPKIYLPRVIIGNKVDGNNGQAESSTPTYAVDVTAEQASETTDGVPGDGRDTWDNPVEFLLSCISMSVGLGNVWRFPGVAARNGGGAFLIPYLHYTFARGRPLYYLEMCMGQFSRFGQVKVWNMSPIFKGIGYGAITGTIVTVSYYCSLMAITSYFLVASFAKDLPWSVCDDTDKDYNCTLIGPEICRQLLQANIDDGLGKLHWKLSLCLVAVWLLVFFTLVKGVKSSGKVAYFTAIFPYVVLIILLVRGLTLKGAWEGIKYFITPEWSALYKPKVWYAAVSQCFFSLTTAFGPIIMFSSYNPFKQDVYKDALIISFVDTFTSLLAGCTVFSSWMTYPQAIAKFGWAPQFFAVMFFLMLLTLGLGSAASLTGAAITILCDQFPKWKRWLVTLVVCTSLCLVGLMYVTEGGMLMLDLVDNYGASFIIYVMAMVECGAISYVYGLSNICDDIEFMLGRHVGIYWRVFAAGYVTGLRSDLYTSMGIHTVATRKAKSLKEKIIEASKPTHRWGPQDKQLRSEWLAFPRRKAFTTLKEKISDILGIFLLGVSM